MYGIVNKAIEELVVENFGEEKWHLIKAKSGIDIDFFISSEAYDDAITFKLAQAVSSEMNLPIDAVFVAFGEWWILKTAKEKYGSLLASGGNSFKEFIVHLPDFHTRVMLMYPNLTPPEFQVTEIQENELNLHYFSKREGLSEFVRGLMQGLAKFYNVEIEIQLVQSRNDGDAHEIFHIQWN
jgi:hypothetical protein